MTIKMMRRIVQHLTRRAAVLATVLGLVAALMALLVGRQVLSVVAIVVIVDRFVCLPVVEFAGHGVEVVLDEGEVYGVVG